MKKLLLIISAVAMLGAMSCKKEYTCNCEISGKEVMEDMDKEEAEAACELIGAIESLAGGGCELE